MAEEPEENDELVGISQSARASATGDSNKLRKDYDKAGRQLQQWFWGGICGLLAVCLLAWELVPRSSLPVPTSGYVFRQAGIWKTNDKSWVWALADTAGRARLLLSTDQGYTWQVHDLGLDSSRAHALALGLNYYGDKTTWGLMVGGAGLVRRLPDVLQSPQQGQDIVVSTNTKESFYAVAVDPTDNRTAMVLGRLTSIRATADSGKSWIQPARAFFSTNEPPQLIIADSLGSFSLFSATQRRTLQVEFPDNSKVDSITQYPLVRHRPLKYKWNNQWTAPLLKFNFEHRIYLSNLKSVDKTVTVGSLIDVNGTVRRYYLNPTSASSFGTTPLASARTSQLFSANMHPAALVWLDSSILLFVNNPQGGQLVRVPVPPGFNDSKMDTVQAISKPGYVR